MGASIFLKSGRHQSIELIITKISLIFINFASLNYF